MRDLRAGAGGWSIDAWSRPICLHHPPRYRTSPSSPALDRRVDQPTTSGTKNDVASGKEVPMR
jgi:hypothetical protein